MGLQVKVEVFLKPGVLDVQGKAIEGALHGLGFGDVAEVRVGKTITFDLGALALGDERAEAAELRVRAMCDRLLANPVIESYRVQIA